MLKKLVSKKKRAKVRQSTAEMVLDALRRRPEKIRHMTPHDIWKKILVKAEITDALNAGMAGISEVARVLVDDTFWKAKFAYDFPDLVEFVGDGLPDWIIPGDPKAIVEFRDLPWRRYYYVARPYMRRIAKAVLRVGDHFQNDASERRNVPYHVIATESHLIIGSTFRVSVNLYDRTRIRTNASIPENRYQGHRIGGGEPVVMTIWQYAAQFIAIDPYEVTAALVRDEFLAKVDPTSLHWFRRKLETDTNIIQIAVIVTGMLDVFTHRDYVERLFVSANDPLKFTPFMTWVVSKTPMWPARPGNPWFQGMDMHAAAFMDDQTSVLGKFRRWSPDVADMALLKWGRTWKEKLREDGQKMIVVKVGKEKKAFLIGCSVCGISDAVYQCKLCHERPYCSMGCYAQDFHHKLCGDVVSQQQQSTVDAIFKKYEQKWTSVGRVWANNAGNQAYFNFRKELVDALLVHVIQDLVKCRECTALSVGSTTLYSDYDLTVTGPKAAAVVDLFNSEFRRLFDGKESSYVFDTNVYGVTWLQPPTSPPGDPIFKHFTARDGRSFSLVRGHAPALQRDWALRKLNDDLDRSDATRMNLAYVRELYAAEEAKKTGDPVVYEDAVSRANYYGAETYFTQGAFLHVVGEIQMRLVGIPITVDQYLDSFVENVGECLRNTETDHMSKYLARAMDALIKARPHHPQAKIWQELYAAAEQVRVNVKGHRLDVKCNAATDATCVHPQTAAQLRHRLEKLIGSPVRTKIVEYMRTYL